MAKGRRFSKGERIALYLVADGKSELSGEPLGEDWHADHIIPWSKGGLTEIANAQVLTAKENLSKGNRMKSYQELRTWQQRFVDAYGANESADFMLAALPGTGKTIAALYSARQFLRSPSRRLIVVVPSNNLREQWKEVARDEFNIKLQTLDFKGTFRTGLDGIVTTYAAVARSPLNFQALSNKHDCMVIFDEIHHCGEFASWGWGIQECFSRASRRLSMSGTPIRTDGQRIPFLTVQGNEYHVDFPYDYPSALRDKHIRRVTFSRYAGGVELLINGEYRELHTQQELNEIDRALLLRKLLWAEPYAKDLLVKANEHLTQMRKNRPNAGGLALCIDMAHAQRVCEWLRQITGEEPDIVVNDDDIANSSVKQYRDSSRRWIVAVRMVSEGVDIKRLMVLAYLTNITANLFFRQAVGRIVRHDGSKLDKHAYCVIPADPQLHKNAETIEKFQSQVIDEDEEEEERTDRGQADRSEGPTIITLDASDSEFVGITVAGESYDPTSSRSIIEAAELANITAAEAAIVFSFIQSQSSQIKEEPHTPSGTDEENETKKILKQCKALACSLAYKWGWANKEWSRAANSQGFAKVHTTYMSEVDNTSHNTMGLVQAKRKREWLAQKLKTV